MASISGICSSSPSVKPQTHLLKPLNSLRRDSVAFPARSRIADRSLSLSLPQSVKGLLEKDPRALWRRYVDWLYQHKDLGLYLDVSRVGFTDEFVAEMEPRFQAAFRAMEELEKGAIANPDEARMVGHYWLRNPKLAPKSILSLQIEKTLDALCKFADDVVSGKVSSSLNFSSVVLFLLSIFKARSALYE